MTTYALLTAVLVLLAITGTLLMIVRDGRGATPAPRSHATDPNMLPPARRTAYRA